MAITTFNLAVSNQTGVITNVIIDDPQSGQHILRPGEEPLVLASRQTRLQLLSMVSPLAGMSGLANLSVRVETFDPQGHIIEDRTWVAADDPYIDPAAVQNALRRVTFFLYRPVVSTTHYQLYCGDDVSSFVVQAGSDRYIVRADSSPVRFDYDGDITLLSVSDPNGDECARDKVDITIDGQTYRLDQSAIIPEKPNGTRSAIVRFFGIAYLAYFRSMLPGLSFKVYVDGVLARDVEPGGREGSILLHSNEIVTLSGFSHPEGHGRPWMIYPDLDGTYQSETADLSSGSYRLWFASRTRRVQASATDKNGMLFYWWSRVYDPVKIKIKKFFSVNMMARIFNNYCDKVYETFRLWERFPPSSLPTVASGDVLTADIFNRVRAIVAALPGVGDLPEPVNENDVVKAAYFEGEKSLKSALNTAILYYMDSDD